MRIEISARGRNHSIFKTYTTVTTPVTIKGLSVGGYSSEADDNLIGIEFDGRAVNNRIYCNHIGLNAQGNERRLLRVGICLGCTFNPQHTIIGTDSDGINDVAERNLISGTYNGININTGGPFTIAGNYFSLTAEGLVLTGIRTLQCLYMRQDLENILVGSNSDGQNDDLERNLFGYCFTGIEMAPTLDPFNMIVAGNWFGLQADRTSGLTDVGLNLRGTAGVSSIKNNWFVSNTTDFIVGEKAVLSSDSTGNCMMGSGTGLDHQGDTVDLAFVDNYWNAVDGPGGDAPGSGSPLLVTGTGSVAYTPFRTAFLTDCKMSLVFKDGFEPAL